MKASHHKMSSEVHHLKESHEHAKHEMEEWQAKYHTVKGHYETL